MILSPESCSGAFDSRKWKWIRTFYQGNDATFWFYVVEGGIRREGLVIWRAMRNFDENFQEKRPKMCPPRNSGLCLHPKMFRRLAIREKRHDSISQRLRRPHLRPRNAPLLHARELARRRARPFHGNQLPLARLNHWVSKRFQCKKARSSPRQPAQAQLGTKLQAADLFSHYPFASS